MTTMMFGPALILATMIAPDAAPQSGAFRPIGGVTARATASVRIVSGVTFGRGQPADAPGAIHRRVTIIDRDGQSRPAELLEFQ